MLSQTSIGSGNNRKGCVRDFFATLLPAGQRTGSRLAPDETADAKRPCPGEIPKP